MRYSVLGGTAPHGQGGHDRRCADSRRAPRWGSRVLGGRGPLEPMRGPGQSGEEATFPGPRGGCMSTGGSGGLARQASDDGEDELWNDGMNIIIECLQ